MPHFFRACARAYARTRANVNFTQFLKPLGLDSYMQQLRKIYLLYNFFIKYGMCLIQYWAFWYLIIFLYLLSVKHFYAPLSLGQL